MLFKREGEGRGGDQQGFPRMFPKAGYVEHDAEEIWKSQSAVAAAVLQRAGLSARDVAAIGITNQRETTVIWNRRTGRPIHHAIVWQDRRPAQVCDQLQQQGHLA